MRAKMCFLLILVLFTGGCSVNATNMALKTGTLTVEVLDGFTEEPLTNATVVIPEIKQTFQTDAQGKTTEIELPILEDTHFTSIQRMPWGEVTLLVYCDGYIPYALFHVAVWENQARQGPRVFMFPVGSKETDQPFTIVESPQRIWVEDLLEQFSPTS